MLVARRITSVIYRFSSNKNNALAVLSNSEKENYIRRLEENALVDYKSYPALPHQDPNSPDYVACELDEYHDKTEAE